MTAVLFICSANRLRSPTAEQVFSARSDLEVMSAGTDPRCGNPVTAELVEWADVIFVMERAHRTKLSKRYRSSLKARVICLNIPDNYEYMDPALVRLLETRVTPHLR